LNLIQLRIGLARLLLVRHVLLVGEIARLQALLSLAAYIRRCTLACANVFDDHWLLICTIRNHSDAVAHLLLMRLAVEVMVGGVVGCLHQLLALVLGIVVNWMDHEGVLLRLVGNMTG